MICRVLSMKNVKSISPFFLKKIRNIDIRFRYVPTMTIIDTCSLSFNTSSEEGYDYVSYVDM